MIGRKTTEITDRPAERGATLLEYGLLVTLVAIFALGAVTAFGLNVNSLYDAIVAALP